MNGKTFARPILVVVEFRTCYSRSPLVKGRVNVQVRRQTLLSVFVVGIFTAAVFLAKDWDTC